jgi:2-keto-4-pentenoate hydratase/2-oxohepta-3-ene-1,7-dioic acid hydratase in catechol pathway
VKLLFFDDYKFGVVKGDNVVDCSDVVKDIPQLEPQHVIKGVIEHFDRYRPLLEAAVAKSDGVPLSSVRIRAPSPKPTRIVCMAVNYNDGMATPRGADAFMKSPDAVIGDGDTMVLGDIPASVFEGEAELALIFGKRARNVSKSDAQSYIFGYTNFIDGSARGLPVAGFYSMKSRATYAPLGPFITTADEIRDPTNLRVRLWNNEELMQDYSTADMAVKIDECIEFVTKAHEMEPGDVLALGTNHRGLHPFQDGHLVEVETEPLGRLHIRVQDDLKRTWQRQTRWQRKEAGEEGATPPQLTGKYAPGS